MVRDQKLVKLSMTSFWMRFFVHVTVITFCVSISPCLPCCERWKVDTKETTISSIIVTRSKQGYQKNRLETPVELTYSHVPNELVRLTYTVMANEPLTKERRKEGITTITAKKLIVRQAPLLSYDLITSPDRTMTPRYIVLCTGYSTAGIKHVFTKSGYIWYHHLFHTESLMHSNPCSFCQFYSNSQSWGIKSTALLTVTLM